MAKNSKQDPDLLYYMIGAFCAVTLSKILSLSYVILDETQTDFLGKPLKVKVPYAERQLKRAIIYDN